MATTVSRQIKAQEPGRVVTAYAGQAILKGTLLVWDSSGSFLIYDGSTTNMQGGAAVMDDGLRFVGVAKDDYPQNRPGKTGTLRSASSVIELYTSGIFEFNTTGLVTANEWQPVGVYDNDTVKELALPNAGAGGQFDGIPCGILVEYLGSNKGLVMIAPSSFFQYQDIIA